LVHESTLDRILVDIVGVVQKVLRVADSVVGKSTLPDLFCASDDRAKRVRVSTFDELNGMFERDVVSRRDEKMDVLGHYDESMKLKAVFAAVSTDRLEEQAGVILDDEKASSVPGREGYEISSGGR